MELPSDPSTSALLAKALSVIEAHAGTIAGPDQRARPDSARSGRPGEADRAAACEGGAKRDATDLPEPLVPEDVDLSDFRWIKFDVIRLLTSEFLIR